MADKKELQMEMALALPTAEKFMQAFSFPVYTDKSAARLKSL